MLRITRSHNLGKHWGLQLAATPNFYNLKRASQRHNLTIFRNLRVHPKFAEEWHPTSVGPLRSSS